MSFVDHNRGQVCHKVFFRNTPYWSRKGDLTELFLFIYGKIIYFREFELKICGFEFRNEFVDIYFRCF